MDRSGAASGGVVGDGGALSSPVLPQAKVTLHATSSAPEWNFRQAASTSVLDTPVQQRASRDRIEAQDAAGVVADQHQVGIRLNRGLAGPFELQVDVGV